VRKHDASAEQNGFQLLSGGNLRQKDTTSRNFRVLVAASKKSSMTLKGYQLAKST
jgi:hypothetical protein